MPWCLIFTMPETRATLKLGPAAWAGQALLYGLFAAAIGVFSQWPRYHPIEPGQALTFTRRLTTLGTDVRDLAVESSAP